MSCRGGSLAPAHLLVDRDGVLNVEPKDGVVSSPQQWRWEHGALDALAACSRHRVRVSVVTNQSCIGRGLVSASEVAALHDWLGAQMRSLRIDLVGIFTCPHAPERGCTCRKPAPGLVQAALRAANTPPASSLLVGDAPRDLAAAKAAGVRSVLVATGKGLDSARAAPEVECHTTLLDALVAAGMVAA